MAEISTNALLSRIKALLKGANLETMTTKKVRQQLESEFNTNLDDRKKEIAKMVESIINESSDEDGDNNQNQNGQSSDSEPIVDRKPVVTKKSSVGSKVKKQRSSSPSSASDADNDDAELARKLQEEEESANKRTTRNRGSSKSSSTKKTKKVKKRKTEDDSSGDEKTAKKRKASGYMRSIPLSDAMAEFTGETELPRSQVVKRIWDYCKEKNLMDPKNKQFAICDNELLKVIGVKRFRLFGMMKLLTKHFIPQQ
jgi:upstream activation factor subunit UAF30